jgi:hypothetical protein
MFAKVEIQYIDFAYIALNSIPLEIGTLKDLCIYIYEYKYKYKYMHINHINININININIYVCTIIMSYHIFPKVIHHT